MLNRLSYRYRVSLGLIFLRPENCLSLQPIEMKTNGSKDKGFFSWAGCRVQMKRSTLIKDKTQDKSESKKNSQHLGFLKKINLPEANDTVLRGVVYC